MIVRFFKKKCYSINPYYKPVIGNGQYYYPLFWRQCMKFILKLDIPNIDLYMRSILNSKHKYVEIEYGKEVFFQIRK